MPPMSLPSLSLDRKVAFVTGTGSGLGDDGEAGPLQQLSRRSTEGAVVVDDENAMIHRLIVPARAPVHGVASPTLSRCNRG